MRMKIFAKRDGRTPWADDVLQRARLYVQAHDAVPSAGRPDDPPELADELAAQRRRDARDGRTASAE